MVSFRECEENVLAPIYHAARGILEAIDRGREGYELTWYVFGLTYAVAELNPEGKIFFGIGVKDLKTKKDLVDFCWEIQALHRDLCVLIQEWRQHTGHLFETSKFPISRDVKPTPDFAPSVAPPSLPLVPRKVHIPPRTSMRDVIMGRAA